MTHRNTTYAIIAAAVIGITAASPNEPITPYFSPNGGATAAIVAELDAAKTTINIASYSFSSARITAALTAAEKRGVAVTAILDPLQQTLTYSTAPDLPAAGIPTYADHAHAIMHNKYIVIDNITVCTGSFNHTDAAEKRNAENLLVIHDAKLAATYNANFALHLKHSDKFQSKNTPSASIATNTTPPTKGDASNGSFIRSDVLTRRQREIRREHCLCQVEGSQLCTPAGDPEESQSCQTSGMSRDVQLPRESLESIDRPKQSDVLRPRDRRSDFHLQRLHVQKLGALAVVKAAHASLSGRRSDWRLRNHDGTPDRPRRLRHRRHNTCD